MAVILTLRSKVDDSETYFLSGTGFQSVKADATTYATKELALPDGMTQREAMGPPALLVIVDQASGEQHAVPNFDVGPGGTP